MRESPYGYWGLETKNTCKTQVFTLQLLQLVTKLPLKKGAWNDCDPQNNSGKSHPAWAKFWSHCMGQDVLWVWLEAKGFTPLVGPAWNGFFPWERRFSKPWASSSAGCLTPACVPILGFKPFLVFLFSSQFMGLSSFLLPGNWNIERGLKISISVKLFIRHFRSHCYSLICLSFQSAQNGLREQMQLGSFGMFYLENFNMGVFIWNNVI